MYMLYVHVLVCIIIHVHIHVCTRTSVFLFSSGRLNLSLTVVHVDQSKKLKSSHHEKSMFLTQHTSKSCDILSMNIITY